MKKTALIVFVVFLLMGTGVMAQQQQQGQLPSPDEMVGMKVQDQLGNELGTIEKAEGEEFVILSSTENPDQMYPVPVDQIQQGPQGDLQAAFDQSTLQQAPSFTQEELQEMSQDQWGSEVRAYYGTEGRQKQ